MKNTHRINGLIYITSEEVINKNDYITDGYKVWKWKDDSSLLGRLKVILSNDQTLTSDGIQAIEPEAVKWLNENPSCEGVDLVFVCERGHREIIKTHYKINLPKQENIEEAADELTFNQLTGTDRDLAKGIAIKLALSQATRDYWFNIFISEQQC